MRLLATLCAGALLVSAPAAAQTAKAQALELLKRGIAFRTVAGEGNQTPAYAAFLKDQLVAGGFADGDVTITPLGDTAYLVARYRGASAGAKPIYLSAHMDVVEARPADWTRDPFTPVVENGFVWGRGAVDNKFDLSAVVATLIRLKREGFRPSRDIVLLLSGDEETSMKTTAALAERFHDAELLLNVDGGGGEYDRDGRPMLYGLQGAEKTYADYTLTFTHPGGHSSAPARVNPIYQLARALDRVAAHQFPGEINEITRAGFEASIDTAEPRLAAAMRRFLADPNDTQALAQLRAVPGLIGQTGTTCVATTVTAGHATNALPQRATSNINCRIFPGTSTATIQAKLAEIVGDPTLEIVELDSGTVASPASPLRTDLMRVVTQAVQARYRGVKVVPSMSAGASDSMWFRAKGVPSYGVSALFMRAQDSFAHGLNERVPLAEIGPAIAHYRTLLRELAK